VICWIDLNKKEGVVLDAAVFDSTCRLWLGTGG